MGDLSDDELDALERLCEAARAVTEGRSLVAVEDDEHQHLREVVLADQSHMRVAFMAHDGGQNDEAFAALAVLFATSPTALPALIAEVRRTRKEG